MSQAYAANPDDEGMETGAPEAETDAQAQPKGLEFLKAAITSPNLAEELDASTLSQIGSKVVEEFKIDETSRAEAGWDERYESAMKLALLAKEEKSYPWPKASNVKFPLIVKAAIEFNARAYPALIDGPEIVKGSINGQSSPEKVARADRIGKHMSWQLLQQMDDWEEDTDSLLIQLPVVGCAFRKTYFDPLKGYNCSHLVSAKDFVVNYMTKDLATCPRATHVLTFYPHEVAEKMRGGTWLTVDLGRPTDAANDDQAPHTFYEQHRLWDLDEDGYPEPYIVTVEKETEKVVRIVARYDETSIMGDDKGKVVRIKPLQSFTKYGFIPSPDGSFYDMGFGTLLGPLGETINSTINQIMDAGHLANVQGGFIGDGVSIKSGNQRFSPGEWKKATTGGGLLKDNIVPLPTKEPSAVLYNLMVFLIDAAKDVTATQDILNGDAGKGTMPVGTVSALIEQGLKTFTAIVKRLHRALKKELGILYRLNGRYLQPQEYFTFQDQQGAVAQADYQADGLDVVPVSDPNMATDMQRMSQAQFVVDLNEKLPNTLKPSLIAERALQAARVPDADQLLIPPQPPQQDPKLMADMAKEADKADIEHRKLDIEEAVSESTIAVNAANAQATMMQTIMAGPQFQQMVAKFIDARVAEIISGKPDGQTGAGPVHGAVVPGMEGGPGQPPVLPPAGGPAHPVDDGVGQGRPEVGGGATEVPPVADGPSHP